METPTRRRTGWRWVLSRWLGRLLRYVRLLLLPPSPAIEGSRSSAATSRSSDWPCASDPSETTYKRLRNDSIDGAECDSDDALDPDSLTFIVDKGVTAPQRMTPGSVGFDVFCPRSVKIPAGESLSVDMGFKVRAPATYFARLNSRSGLAKEGLQCFSGIIDRGNEISAPLSQLQLTRRSFQIMTGTCAA